MKNIFILINREFLIFFKNIVFNLFFYFSFPLLTYLFLVILFSNLFEADGLKNNAQNMMDYLYYAFSSILFVCTSMIAFTYPLILIIRDREKLSYMYTTKLNHFNYFSSIIICVILFSYIEFLVAYLISNQLIELIIHWEQIFYFFIIIFPCILFFSTLGLLISNFIKNYQGLLVASIFLFLLLAFGSFTFIPIYYFSDQLNYVSFTKSYNIIFHLYDMFISIFDNRNLGLQTFIISIFLSFVFYGMHLLIISKKKRI